MDDRTGETDVMVKVRLETGRAATTCPASASTLFQISSSTAPIGSRSRAGSATCFEVTDTRGEQLPTAQHPCPGAESGRGLLLVEAPADRWGTAPGLPPRKTVWAEVTVRQAPGPGNVGSGATGGLSPKNPGEKEPHQTPP
ncbi:ATP-binding protein, partial [Streptomyces scabiei]|nr:ATP-binding protein [Streptomyces scabiei]